MIDIKRLTKKKIVVVTGSTRGIGFAIAKRFADYGYFVVLNGRERHALNLATAEIEKMGIPCAGAAGDSVTMRLVSSMRWRARRCISRTRSMASRCMEESSEAE